MPSIRHLFDALVSRARFERDLRDEVRQHLDARTQDLIDTGLRQTLLHARRASSSVRSNRIRSNAGTRAASPCSAPCTGSAAM